MNAELKDRCVLITGASGGIGLATAEAFAAEGAKLVLNYHSRPGPLQELQPRLNVPTVLAQADLRDERQVEQMFATGLQQFGRIDAIVANAGIWPERPAPLWEMSTEQWHGTMAADLDSAFFTCRAFLRHFADQRRDAASIVLIGSTAAIFGEADHADYSAAKAAMTYGLTCTLKNEIVRLAPRGRVNAVCPGWTRTPMAEYGLRDATAVRRVHSTMALRKVAEAEDVAAAIVFLASDRLAGHLSGTVLPVAGGMEGRLLHNPAGDGA